MMIYPAPHYTMGGLWVDYELQTTIPGLFAIGEANFSDHGANRLGASALMQTLADGYFIAPHTVTNYMTKSDETVGTGDSAFDVAQDRVETHINRLIDVGGSTVAQDFHQQMGDVMLDKCGMARTAEGLTEALARLREIKNAFWSDLRVDPGVYEFNQSLEYANRVSDFLELGELMCHDALRREESCGGHFREEYETEDGEALRDDEHFAKVTAWEYTGENGEPVPHDEQLTFENVKLATRSYK
jgi:succinate dehydrogenase / fumarate reductase flavoprotein subunit